MQKQSVVKKCWSKTMLAGVVAAAVIPSVSFALSVDDNVPSISYVSFPAVGVDSPLTVSAQLRVPQNMSMDTKVPAVVIVHGSAGIDSRGSFYADKLNDAGIATLEIDLFAQRGWTGPNKGRPRSVPETLPDAYGALQYMSQLHYIDKEHIGIMGFSWGGVVSMLTATERYEDQYTASMSETGLHFAAHVAHYPVCWGYNKVPGYEFSHLTQAPLLIEEGFLDDYDAPQTCSDLVSTLTDAEQSRVSVNMYDNAYHAFDRLQPEIVVSDPYSHEGMGGDVVMSPNIDVAREARRNVTRFFKRALLTN